MAFKGIGTVNPFRNFKFLVEITTGNGIFASAGFMKCTGLVKSSEVLDYREGGENHTMHKLPGQVKFDPIVLERGATQNKEMYVWAEQVDQFDGAGIGNGNFNPVRGSMIISTLDALGGVLQRYNVIRCWVSEFRAGEYDASSNGVLMESITVQHEGWKLDKSSVIADGPGSFV